jgi:hypothetical protein
MRIFFLGIVFYFLLADSLMAQKEDFQWIFNWTRVDDLMDWPDLGATVIDFAFDPPLIERNEKITLDFLEEQALICDQNGQLLLYSNAQSVHGPDHMPIVNGDTINFGPNWLRFAWENEHDELKPFGFAFSNCIGIIPIPLKINEFLVLYLNFENFKEIGFKLKFAKAIFSQPLNKYELIEKDKNLLTGLSNSPKITACRHANGRDWWWLNFQNDTVSQYLIDPTGIHYTGMQTIPFQIRDGVGQVKYNPLGDKLIYYAAVQLNSPTGVDFALFDFDRCTGQLSNPQYRKLASWDNLIDNGVEFSANGRFVYRCHNEKIYQYDTEAQDFMSSFIIVAEYDGYTAPVTDFPSHFGLMQRGPDNKIYCALAYQDYYLHVIHHPDKKGEACNVVQRGIEIPTYVQGTMPALNTYRLGPLDGSGCDTLDIDNHPQAWFRYEQDSLNYLDIQFVDLSYFRPESYHWNFGDGNTSSDKSPLHSFDNNGSYKVCLTVSNENSEHQYCRDLIIGTSSVKDNFDYNISLFPNPVQAHCRISFHNYLPQSAVLNLFNTEGRQVASKKLSGSLSTIDLSSMESAVYFYTIKDGNALLKEGKLVKL